MNETLDPEGWARRLPEWQREEPHRPARRFGRFRAALHNERVTLYVTLVALLWLAYFVMRSGVAAMHRDVPEFAQVTLFLAVSGFVLTLLFGLVVHRCERIGFVPALAAMVMAVFVGSWLSIMIGHKVQLLTSPGMAEKIEADPELFRVQMWHAFYLHVYVFMAWGCLHFMVRYFVSLQRQRQETLRAVALAQEAKLEVLRYQLNPHFLFNALNAISTLVLQKKTKMAEQTIDRLSTFLRHTLASDPKQQVTLAQELEAINLYLQIQKVRFGRRMVYEFHVGPETMEGCVPSLILQPIVENAVKYGVTPLQEGGRVEISARRDGANLLIEVCDTGPGIVDPGAVSIKGTGVGLANCRARLREFYGPDASLILVNRETQGLCVRIVIPYREAPRDES